MGVLPLVIIVACAEKATIFPLNLIQLGLKHSKAMKSRMHITTIERRTTPCFTVCLAVKDARSVMMIRHACSNEILLWV